MKGPESAAIVCRAEGLIPSVRARSPARKGQKTSTRGATSVAGTLVVAIGEMGRTPRANPSWGRNHWSTLFSALLAGGGVRGGTTYGTNDAQAVYPTDHPIRPEDLAATTFDALGIDPELRIPNSQRRPVSLVENAKRIDVFGWDLLAFWAGSCRSLT